MVSAFSSQKNCNSEVAKTVPLLQNVGGGVTFPVRRGSWSTNSLQFGNADGARTEYVSQMTTEANQDQTGRLTAPEKPPSSRLATKLQPVGHGGKKNNAKGKNSRWGNHNHKTCMCAVCRQLRGESKSSWYNHDQSKCACAVCRQSRGESRLGEAKGSLRATLGEKEPLPTAKRGSWMALDEPKVECRTCGTERPRYGGELLQSPLLAKVPVVRSTNTVVKSTLTPLPPEHRTPTATKLPLQQQLYNWTGAADDSSGVGGHSVSSPFLAPSPNVFDAHHERLKNEQRLGFYYRSENLKAGQPDFGTNFFSKSRLAGWPESDPTYSRNSSTNNLDDGDCFKARQSWDSPTTMSYDNGTSGVPWQKNTIDLGRKMGGTSTGLHNVGSLQLQMGKLNQPFMHMWELKDETVSAITDVAEGSGLCTPSPYSVLCEAELDAADSPSGAYQGGFHHPGQSASFLGAYPSSVVAAHLDIAVPSNPVPEIDGKASDISWNIPNFRPCALRSSPISQFPFGLEVQVEHDSAQPAFDLNETIQTQSMSFNYDQSTTGSSSPPFETVYPTSVLHKNDNGPQVMDIDSGDVVDSSSVILQGGEEMLMLHKEGADGEQAKPQQLLKSGSDELMKPTKTTGQPFSKSSVNHYESHCVVQGKGIMDTNSGDIVDSSSVIVQVGKENLMSHAEGAAGKHAKPQLLLNSGSNELMKPTKAAGQYFSKSTVNLDESHCVVPRKGTLDIDSGDMVDSSNVTLLEGEKEKLILHKEGAFGVQVKPQDLLESGSDKLMKPTKEAGQHFSKSSVNLGESHCEVQLKGTMGDESGDIADFSSVLLQGGGANLMLHKEGAVGGLAKPQQLIKSRSDELMKPTQAAGQHLSRSSVRLGESHCLVPRKGRKRKQVTRVSAQPGPKWRRLIHNMDDHYFIARKICIRTRVSRKRPQSSISSFFEPNLPMVNDFENGKGGAESLTHPAYENYVECSSRQVTTVPGGLIPMQSESTKQNSNQLCGSRFNTDCSQGLAFPSRNKYLDTILDVNGEDNQKRIQTIRPCGGLQGTGGLPRTGDLQRTTDPAIMRESTHVSTAPGGLSSMQSVLTQHKSDELCDGRLDTDYSQGFAFSGSHKYLATIPDVNGEDNQRVLKMRRLNSSRIMPELRENEYAAAEALHSSDQSDGESEAAQLEAFPSASNSASPKCTQDVPLTFLSNKSRKTRRIEICATLKLADPLIRDILAKIGRGLRGRRRARTEVETCHQGTGERSQDHIRHCSLELEDTCLFQPPKKLLHGKSHCGAFENMYFCGTNVLSLFKTGPEKTLHLLYENLGLPAKVVLTGPVTVFYLADTQSVRTSPKPEIPLTGLARNTVYKSSFNDMVDCTSCGLEECLAPLDKLHSKLSFEPLITSMPRGLSSFAELSSDFVIFLRVLRLDSEIPCRFWPSPYVTDSFPFLSHKELTIYMKDQITFNRLESMTSTLSHLWLMRRQCNVNNSGVPVAKMTTRSVGGTKSQQESYDASGFVNLRSIFFPYCVDKPLYCCQYWTRTGLYVSNLPGLILACYQAEDHIIVREEEQMVKCKMVPILCLQGEDQECRAERQHKKRNLGAGKTAKENALLLPRLISKCDGAEEGITLIEEERLAKGQRKLGQPHCLNGDQQEFSSERQNADQNLGDGITSNEDTAIPVNNVPPNIVRSIQLHTVPPVQQSSALQSDFTRTSSQQKSPASTFQELLKSVLRRESSSCDSPQLMSNNCQSGSDSSVASHHVHSSDGLPSIPDLDVWEGHSVLRSDDQASASLSCSTTPLSKPARKRGCPKGGWSSRGHDFEKGHDGPVSRDDPLICHDTASQHGTDIEADFAVLQPTMVKLSKKQNSEYKKKLEIILGNPFSLQELKDLEKHVSVRKPVMRLRETRQRVLHVATKRDGMSYLDHHPDLARKVADAGDREEKLRLLRGFVFWLQHACTPGSFKPWALDFEEAEESDDCVEVFPEVGVLSHVHKKAWEGRTIQIPGAFQIDPSKWREESDRLMTLRSRVRRRKSASGRTMKARVKRE